MAAPGTPQSAAFDDGELHSLYTHIGSRVRARRLFMNMSEGGLAGRLGISVERVRAFEEGRAHAHARDLYALSLALSVAVRFFFQDYAPSVPRPAAASPMLREVDRWLCDHVLPHERAFMAVARRMTGNAETARDIVQETYADMLTGEKWRSIENPRAYAMRALRNYALTLLQRARIVPIELMANVEMLSHADPAPDAHELLSAKEKRDLLLRAIEALPPKCRQVVKLRRLCEMPQKQIAKHLGITESSVEKHLARAMVLLADKRSE